MVANKKHKKNSKKAPKPSRKTTRRSGKTTTSKPVAKISQKASPIMSVQLTGRTVLPPVVIKDSRVFSIEIDSISGETTIGDLIVAFPRTRDVLMKHGLRFDVEEAGYLYMTLNVFSAIHGVTSNNLIQELHTASKEPPEPPAQTLRPIAAPPTP
jgi:hypothetical protein